ncbi:hypothetical protein T190130A13A_110013 [Tenacibaculum sp. 190130A14a]|uniref:Uncharacterized protein n=1 Tax=Tenacibaculum polynesiense TaxID=3137857 RepID=A0ABP1EYL4_9FLAO
MISFGSITTFLLSVESNLELNSRVFDVNIVKNKQNVNETIKGFFSIFLSGVFNKIIINFLFFEYVRISAK